jgi:hypothetical protein
LRGPGAALRSLDTREALLLAFFAAFIVLAKAALRWHLHVPGHSMFATSLFLVLARTCIPRFGAATATGLLAGLATAALGMGRGGPLLVAKLLLPGLVVDVGARLPLRPRGLHGALLGALAGASGFFPTAAIEALAGAPGDLVVRHALVSAGAKTGFGALGGWAASAIAKRLREHGLVAEEEVPPHTATSNPRSSKRSEGGSEKSLRSPP